MIYITKSFIHEGKQYHQVKIHTACCKDEFLVLVEGNKFTHMGTGEELLPGMVQTIKQQLRMQNER